MFLNGTCLVAITLYNQAKTEKDRREVAASSLVFGILCITVIGGLALTFARSIGELIGVPDPDLMRLGSLVALLDALIMVCLALNQARIEAISYSAVTVLQMFVRIGLIALFVLVFGWGIRGILQASLITSGTFCVLLVASQAWRFGLQLRWKTVLEIAKFSLPFLPAGFCGFLIGSGDQFFLVRNASARDVGLYALGYKLAGMAFVFTRDPLIKVWGARMHQVATAPDAPQTFGRVFSSFVGLYLFVGLGIVLFSAELLALLSDQRYAYAAAYVAPIVLAYFFMGCCDLMDGAFYIRRRTGLKLWLTLGTTAIVVGLYLLLIPKFRGEGAALATLGGFAFRAVITYLVTQRLFPIAYQWGRVAALICMTLALWLVSFCFAGALFPVGPLVKLALWLLWPAFFWCSGILGYAEKQAFALWLEENWRNIRSVWWGRTSAAFANEQPR
jgi:O-antigen/teichoic acid export membrane protein